MSAADRFRMIQADMPHQRKVLMEQQEEMRKRMQASMASRGIQVRRPGPPPAAAGPPPPAEDRTAAPPPSMPPYRIGKRTRPLAPPTQPSVSSTPYASAPAPPAPVMTTTTTPNMFRKARRRLDLFNTPSDARPVAFAEDGTWLFTSGDIHPDGTLTVHEVDENTGEYTRFFLRVTSLPDMFSGHTFNILETFLEQEE